MGLAYRGVARWWLGRPGWQLDLHDAGAMARNSDPRTCALVVAATYGLAMYYGVRRADDSAVRVIEEAMQITEETSDDFIWSSAQCVLGLALLSRGAPADRHRGLALVVRARGM
jgi:hypothetical protein